MAPNFHWGFMAKGLAESKSPLSVEDYCAYWIREVGATREIPRAEWKAYVAKLVAAKIIDAAGVEKFDTEFTDTQRKKAHPRPGLLCEYQWSLATAQNQDSQKKFVAEVRKRLNAMLTALNAPTVPAAQMHSK